jgi:hypothetical protein
MTLHTVDRQEANDCQVKSVTIVYEDGYIETLRDFIVISVSDRPIHNQPGKVGPWNAQCQMKLDTVPFEVCQRVLRDIGLSLVKLSQKE